MSHCPGAGSGPPYLPPGHGVGHSLRPALCAAPRLQEHQGQAGAVSDAGPHQRGLRGRGHSTALPQDVPQPLHEGGLQGGEAEAREAGSPPQLHGASRPHSDPGTSLRRLSGESHPAAGPGLILGRVIREVIIFRSGGSSSICHSAGWETRGHLLKLLSYCEWTQY